MDVPLTASERALAALERALTAQVRPQAFPTHDQAHSTHAQHVLHDLSPWEKRLYSPYTMTSISRLALTLYLAFHTSVG